jgi:predicted cobalt transporter CbtA
MCVDCEERGTPSATMARLLAARQTEDESWLSAHGYTIASVVVSALVAAIIYWLH